MGEMISSDSCPFWRLWAPGLRLEVQNANAFRTVACRLSACRLLVGSTWAFGIPRVDDAGILRPLLTSEIGAASERAVSVRRGPIELLAFTCHTSPLWYAPD
jgi:hypothetical protein